MKGDKIMKKIIVFCALLFCTAAIAQTINWYVDGSLYQTTTCNPGDDLILPTAPTKYGYTFRGWSRYTLLQYIESTGTQWIDTGILVSSLDAEIVTIETTMQMLSTGEGDYFAAIPIESGTILYDVSSNGNCYIRWGTTGYATVSRSGSLYVSDRLHKIKVTGMHEVFIYIDDVLIGTNRTSSAQMANPHPILIGHGRTTPKGRWQDFKIQNGNDVVFHGVAVRRGTDGEIGMYDLVSQTFFGNAGTGTFIAGPDL